MTFNKILLAFSIVFFLIPQMKAQEKFTRADSLRGGMRAERSCFDVTFYDLAISVNAVDSSISGQNDIHFTVLEPSKRIQLDLFRNMNIKKVIWREMDFKVQREEDAFFVNFPVELKKGSKHIVTVVYDGKPQTAHRPPWDGGFVWKSDPKGKPWVGVACEGTGASLWWPLKDHLSDEPDSMRFSIALPKGPLDGLMAVANGDLRSKKTNKAGETVFEWFISYPINSYNVTLNIADYVNIHEHYTTEGGEFKEIDYYVLSSNEDTAKKHFAQVPEMISIFEKYFGPYPYWNDGYALVETDYWGMEHQGAIAYGNRYKNNSFGWDFIIVHESGHEWWGNNVSTKDHAALWIHESFCTYSEAVYMEALYGYDDMITYLNSQKLKIKNEVPILGPKGVNYDGWPDADMYYKGSWMLHTLRNVLSDDMLWWDLLKGIQEEFGGQTIDTEDIINYINNRTGQDFQWFWDQYLKQAEAPVLEYKFVAAGANITLSYRWMTKVKDFVLPVGLETGLEGPRGKMTLKPTTEWQTVTIQGKAEKMRFDIDRGYFKMKQVGN